MTNTNAFSTDPVRVLLADASSLLVRIQDLPTRCYASEPLREEIERHGEMLVGLLHADQQSKRDRSRAKLEASHE